MQKIILLLLTLVGTSLALAQNKTVVELENQDSKYHLKIETEVNGEKATIEKTYSSLEELKNDPDLAAYDLHLFTGKGEEDSFEIVMHLSEKEGAEEGKPHTVKAWVNTDGQQHVVVDGEEEMRYIIKENDGKITVKTSINDTDSAESTVMLHIGEDENIEVQREEGEVVVITEKGIHKFTSEGDKVLVLELKQKEELADEASNKTVKVVVFQHRIKVEDIKGDEFKGLPGVDSRELKMNNLNYYPNPSRGKFTLAFTTGKKPLTVKIMGLDGQTVYEESIKDFTGTYSKEIDLSTQPKGMYLLQVMQGNKTMNKKIIIQ